MGIQIGKKIPPNGVVCLFGELAAGKTTLIKGIAKGACGVSEEEVNSPTFVYLNIYSPQDSLGKTVYHFDLYRLQTPEEFLGMGFEEFFYAQGICLIEWSERISSILPKDKISIFLKHCGLDCREVIVESETFCL